MSLLGTVDLAIAAESNKVNRERRNVFVLTEVQTRFKRSYNSLRWRLSRSKADLKGALKEQRIGQSMFHNGKRMCKNMDAKNNKTPVLVAEKNITKGIVVNKLYRK